MRENAFLNEDFRQDLLAAGATTLQLDRLYTDVGLRFSQVDRNSLSFVGGLKGEFETGFSDLRYDIYGTYGRTKAKFIGYNRMLLPNLRAALDAVVDPVSGDIRCRMDVPALQPVGYVRPTIVGGGTCVPFNPFGSTSQYPGSPRFRQHDDSVQRLRPADHRRFLALRGSEQVPDHAGRRVDRHRARRRVSQGTQRPDHRSADQGRRDQPGIVAGL